MESRRHSEAGFTLVELMVSMTILVMIAGVAYAAFTTALKIYHVDARELALTQRLRLGLSDLTRDMSNAIVSQGDPNLTLIFEDVPGELPTEGADVISFVTAVVPNISNGEGAITSALPPSRRASRSTPVDDEDSSTPPDIVRVAYVLGVNPDALTPITSRGSQPTVTLALLRVTSRTLDFEEAFGDAFSQSGTAMLEALDQLGATVEVAVLNTRSLNFALYDGEEWYPDWDSEDQGVPRAIRVAVAVQEPSSGEMTYSRSSTALLHATPVPAPAQGQGNQAQQQGGPQSGPPQQG